jgi:hypothetical protein
MSGPRVDIGWYFGSLSFDVGKEVGSRVWERDLGLRDGSLFLL